MNDKQQLSAMGEHLAEQQQPMCMAKRIEELEAQVEKMTNRLAWRNTGSPNGLRRFMTQKQYDAQTPGVQKWYEPIRYEVPEGWSLVPDMPTPEMCAAFHKANADWEDGWAFDDNGNRHDSPVYQWVAMLSAAPSPDSDK